MSRVCTWLIWGDKVYLTLTIWMMCVGGWMTSSKRDTKDHLNWPIRTKYSLRINLHCWETSSWSNGRPERRGRHCSGHCGAFLGVAFSLLGLSNSSRNVLPSELTVYLHLRVRAVLCAPDELTHCFFICCFMWTTDSNSRLTLTQLIMIIDLLWQNCNAVVPGLPHSLLYGHCGRKRRIPCLRRNHSRSRA